MKLPAKLAFSQIKANRSRTAWTLTGVALSTALITAVCGFAASGGKLVADLFGEDYGGSGETLAALLLIPAGVLIAVIIALSAVVISNAFRVSAGERTAQFGILKSVGATKRQITATVLYESIFLSAAGIPMGIITGLILSFAGVQAANHFLGELNNLIHMMLNEISIVIEFVIAWRALLAAALISFFAVLLSAWLPARKAAKIAAIDAIRGASEVKKETKRLRVSPLTQKLFGFEGTLAAKNMKRSKRNFRASMVSLTVSVVLFVTLSSLGEQARRLENVIYPDIGAPVIVDYTSLRDSFPNESTGRTETIIAAPIDSEIANAAAETLRGYQNTPIFGVGDDMETYTALIPKEIIAPQMQEAYFYPEERSEYETPAEIITLDKENYAALCGRANVPLGSNILINHYSYNDNGHEVTLEPFLFDGGDLRLLKADGSVSEIPVHGVLTRDDIPNELLPLNRQVVRVIVPQSEARSYIWYANPADIDEFMEYANAVMGEMFPQTQDSGYMEAGFSTRVYTMRDYMKVMNTTIVLVMIFVYAFVALLTLIGLTGVISTISANTRMRSREFAVLRSVGMTYGGLKRMLNFESVMCTSKSLTVGLPLAIALTYLINLPIRAAFPIPYRFPWLAALGCITAVFAVTWAAMRYSASRLRGENTIETIRAERIQ
ncbi:MAG: ABC transporter permease [Oscillospiraceae bacterium]|jgi:putative ABC transport system permease protein|nr:ABC transporter permease [Oscillospiraceae bacterium]